MFLATTSLKQFWDAGDGLLLLGPWCLRYEDPDYAGGLRYTMLPNVWDDRTRLEQGARYCREIQGPLLARLTRALNGIHGADHNERYWTILLGPWLTFYTHQLYDRYTQILQALKSHPDLKTACLSPEDFYTPADTEDFLRFFHTDHYNLQLYSQIFKFLGKTAPELRLAGGAPVPMAAAPRGLVKRLKAPLRGLVHKGCGWTIRHKKVDIVTDELYPSGALLWSLVRAMGGQMLPLLETFPDSLRAKAAPSAARAGLAQLAGDDVFQKLLISTLPVALPALFLEGYAKARAHVVEEYPKAPRAVFAGTGLYYNEYLKLVAAHWVEQGARLLGLQHGGQYGTAKFSLAEEHERRVSDLYFTWGWSSTADDPRVGDLPSPKLSVMAKAKAFPWKIDSKDILLVSAEGMKNAHHLFPTPMGLQWEEYFQWRKRFIMGFPQELRGALCARLSTQDYGWAQRRRVKETFPDLRLDDTGVPFVQRMIAARLVVTDHPGTTLLEVMALNKPSVHFWNENLWELRPEAEPCFEGLRKAGILHKDPESAAFFIQEIYEDIPKWWLSDKTQAARRAFTRLYARTDDNWLGAWTSALRREIV